MPKSSKAVNAIATYNIVYWAAAACWTWPRPRRTPLYHSAPPPGPSAEPELLPEPDGDVDSPDVVQVRVSHLTCCVPSPGDYRPLRTSPVRPSYLWYMSQDVPSTPSLKRRRAKEPETPSRTDIIVTPSRTDSVAYLFDRQQGFKASGRHADRLNEASTRPHVGAVLLSHPHAPPMVTAAELSTLRQIIDLLKPIERATLELGAEKVTTLGKVVPMTKIITEQPTACANGISSIARLMEEMVRERERTPSPIPPEQPPVPTDDFWGEHDVLVAAQQNAAPTITLAGGMPTELKIYLDQPLEPRTTDPVLYWERMASTFPVLSPIALRYAVLPATSVPSERLFSEAGQTASERRSRLKPDHLQALMFLANVAAAEWGGLLD
ncbi:Zinc finger BED domain-containing protein 4 [Frankliniella fusca]|uniref:Zinc finger BED domain-containing protein 4 n=1 Tax=Frankliniella fusca TaxID=407009 RepID=A0AAE1LST3_9NEOP|nr:Zinc finger BED domain-containing protein 4 [Frankliniella fusca]